MTTCKICGQTGGSYFEGHDDPRKPHPHFPEMGTEGWCAICGEAPDTVLHNQHNALKGKPPERSFAEIDAEYAELRKNNKPLTEEEEEFNLLCMLWDLWGFHGIDPDETDKKYKARVRELLDGWGFTNLELNQTGEICRIFSGKIAYRW